MAVARNKVPWPLVLGYAIDWIFIIIIAAIGGGLSYKTPASRLFSPLNPAISYPYAGHGISTSAMFVLCIVMPGLVIVAVVILLPLPTNLAQLRTAPFWRSKAWEINAGWLGLALANALAIAATQIVKASFGKPRPDLLDRCRPDLSGLDISASTLPSALLLDRSACTQTDKAVLDDGFRSFFSGHSSSSFAGLLYFALWLALKFNVILPRPWKRRGGAITSSTASRSTDAELAAPSAGSELATTSGGGNSNPREQAAAPPTWGALLFFAPVMLAAWIASTRWIEYKHDGWDVGFGILAGSFCAVVGFRWYHSDPVKGESWTWAPRERREAFFLRPGDAVGGGPGGHGAAVAITGGHGIKRKSVNGSGSYHGVSSDGAGDGDAGYATGASHVSGEHGHASAPAAGQTHAPSSVQPYPQA